MKKYLLTLDDMLQVSGGDEYDKAYEKAVELARYMDILSAKYQCSDVRILMKRCTPEEKARIRELRNAVFADMP